MTDESPTSSASPMSVSAALSSDDEQIVAAFDTVLEAEMARGRLVSDGIPSRLVDGNTVGIATHLSLAIGGVKVVVASRDLEAARTILFAPSTFKDELLEVEPREDRETAVVPAVDVDANRAMKQAVVGLVLLPPLGHLLSLWTLAAVFRRRDQLSPQGKRRAAIALGIDALVAAVIGYVWIMAH